MHTLPPEIHLLILESVITTAPNSLLPLLLTSHAFYNLFKRHELRLTRKLVVQHVGRLRPYTRLLIYEYGQYKTLEREIQGEKLTYAIVPESDDESDDAPETQPSDKPAISERIRDYQRIYRMHAVGAAIIRHLCSLYSDSDLSSPPPTLSRAHILALYFLRLWEVGTFERRARGVWFSDVLDGFREIRAGEGFTDKGFDEVTCMNARRMLREAMEEEGGVGEWDGGYSEEEKRAKGWYAEWFGHREYWKERC